MTKEEFDSKVKEVSKTIHSLVDDDGVSACTSLYGFLLSASMAMDLAVFRVNGDYVSNDLVEVTLHHDEERD